MALSRVGGSSAAATSIAIPAHVAGDLIVIWAYRDGNTTPPSVPAAGGTVPTFTTIDGPTGANACSAICAWAVAAGTTDTSGTWTNATGISVEVWRGAAAAPIGGHAQSGGNIASGANISIPAVTQRETGGGGVLLGFVGWQTVTAWNAAPTGYTQQSQVATEVEVLSKNSTTTDGAFNVTGTASGTGGTRTQQIELIPDLGNRVSQEAVEALYNTTGALSRVSQEAVEAVYGTTSAQARVSQVAVEALVHIPTVAARVSQVAVEVLTPKPTVPVPFIASATTVYAPALVGIEAVPFIPSVTAVYVPVLSAAALNVPFISSNTVVYAPSLSLIVPFIPSHTHVWSIYSIFDPNKTYGGPGNGGESFALRLNANGVTDTATLAVSLGVGISSMTLSGDSAFPVGKNLIVTIDSEQILVFNRGSGLYSIHGRGMGNTTAASHTAGATIDWGDSYDQAIAAASDISHEFTADINSTGSFTYPGWLICFDSSQGYLSGSRYPMHVTEVVGVFDAGAGTGGTNRCDQAQPNAVCAPATTSDYCPAALSNPARISSDIAIGDVAVVRYTNPEATVLDLGPRAVTLQSWFGLMRVSTSNADVTFTDPNGIVVDTTGTYDTFTGSVNGVFAEPLPLQIGIAPDASDAAGHAVPTPGTVPWETVTLPGTDRKFTFGSGGGGYNRAGWPICCIAVRQGKKRVPFWQSWDWRDYSYVYTGFGTDATYAQLLINRNGIVFDSVPAVSLPGPQDIDGPDAVWDDATYFFGCSWYVVLFNGPYIVHGPTIGGTISGGGVGGAGGFSPGVVFTGGGGFTISVPPFIEGGSGGNISPGVSGLHVWATSGKGFS